MVRISQSGTDNVSTYKNNVTIHTQWDGPRELMYLCIENNGKVDFYWVLFLHIVFWLHISGYLHKILSNYIGFPNHLQMESQQFVL